MASRREKGSDETNSSEAPTRVALPDLEPPSEDEARRYYSRLPSRPRLVGRTTDKTMWQTPPLGGRIHPYSEEITTIGQHKIIGLWDGILETLLEHIKDLPWTSVDVVRIGLRSVRKMDKPVIVWVGVSTADIPWPRVASSLRACRVLLDSRGLDDVGVEIRVAAVSDMAGPALMPANIRLHNEINPFRQDYTTAVGQSFAAEKAPWMQGTLGLYLCAAGAGQSSDLFALTCRHVALPEEAHPGNRPYGRPFLSQPSQPADKMIIPSSASQERWSTKANTLVEDAQESLQAARQLPYEDEDPDDVLLEEAYLRRVMGWKQIVDSLEAIPNRVVGEVVFAPPISQAFYNDNNNNNNNNQEKPWTRDWSLVRLDLGKFPDKKMPQNVVDLRTAKWDRDDLTQLLNPHPQSPHKFTVPKDGLLPLAGVIPLDELHRPNMIDKHGNDCILVGKRGSATGLTLGTANEIRSVVRRSRGKDAFIFISHEWVITELDRAVFSAGGDSGSVVFDIKGRIGGMITGGTRGTVLGEALVDLTYATPMAQLLPDISEHMGFPVNIV